MSLTFKEASNVLTPMNRKGAVSRSSGISQDTPASMSSGGMNVPYHKGYSNLEAQSNMIEEVGILELLQLQVHWRGPEVEASR